MRETESYLLEDAIRARNDRHEFFTKGFNYLDENAILGTLNGKVCRFYWNINLYIDMLSECNGNCSFCINRVNYKREDVPDNIFLKNLEESVQLVRFLNPSIQIAGGEPTLAPNRMYSVLDLVQKYGLRNPVINTNGSGLINQELLNHIEPVIAHVNISRHHDNKDTADSLMGLVNPLDNNILKEIIQTHALGPKIRLNCCLLNNGIQTYEDVVRYLNWALKMGVRDVCFSALSQLPYEYIYNSKFIKRCEDKSPDFESIMASVTDDPRFAFLKFHVGSHGMYEIWQYSKKHQHCNVVFAISDNNFARKLDEIDHLFELLVFHSDGVLTGSWNRLCKVI